MSSGVGKFRVSVQRYLVTQRFEFLHGAPFDLVTLEAVEKRSSHFFVMTLAGQHGVAGHQQAVSHRDVGWQSPCESYRFSGVRSRIRLLRSRLRARTDFNRFFCPGFR
jgi:hypothetical protein